MINISQETHPELYSMPIEVSLEYAAKLESKEIKDEVLFHSYWHVGGEFTRKQQLVIKSYLATQNLEKTKYILWSNIDLSDNEFIKPFLGKIELRIYDPYQESKGTPLENKTTILGIKDKKCWNDGDIFRLLILHNYGGVYVDMDMILLRDFSPLLEQEFMYKWGCLPTDNQGGINGAIMRLFKKSKLSYDLLNTVNFMPIIPESNIWGCELYKTVRTYVNNNWLVLPAAFFNPEWQDDPNRNWGSDDNNAFADNPYKLYEGAFSWHWHNRWNDYIHPNSKWACIEKIIDKKLNG